MIVKLAPDITRTPYGYSLTFNVDDEEIDNLEALSEYMQNGNEYELVVKKRTKKKSRDANSYAWKLIGLIAGELGIPPIEVYQQQILNMYCYRDVLLKDEEIPKEIADWKTRGVGWLTEIVGPSPQHKGYSWLRKYRGSSTFDSREMSKFIDNIIYEAKQLGIQTEPPKDIDTIKKNWNANFKTAQ